MNICSGSNSFKTEPAGGGCRQLSPAGDGLCHALESPEPGPVAHNKRLRSKQDHGQREGLDRGSPYVENIGQQQSLSVDGSSDRRSQSVLPQHPLPAQTHGRCEERPCFAQERCLVSARDLAGRWWRRRRPLSVGGISNSLHQPGSWERAGSVCERKLDDPGHPQLCRAPPAAEQDRHGTAGHHNGLQISGWTLLQSRPPPQDPDRPQEGHAGCRGPQLLREEGRERLEQVPCKVKVPPTCHIANPHQRR